MLTFDCAFAGIFPAPGCTIITGTSRFKKTSINGCDIAQGYFYSRPLPLAEAENWLKTWRPEPPERPVKTVG